MIDWSIDWLIDKIYLNTVVLSEIKLQQFLALVNLETMLWITKYLQDFYGFLLIR